MSGGWMDAELILMCGVAAGGGGLCRLPDPWQLVAEGMFPVAEWVAEWAFALTAAETNPTQASTNPTPTPTPDPTPPLNPDPTNFAVRAPSARKRVLDPQAPKPRPQGPDQAPGRRGNAVQVRLGLCCGILGTFSSAVQLHSNRQKRNVLPARCIGRPRNDP